MAVWLEIPKEEITLTEIGQISERMDKFFLRYWDGESKPNYWQLEIRGGEDKYERDRQKIHKELYNQLEKLRNDKKVVLEAISQKNDSLKDFPFFQDDKEVVLEAVKKDGYALRFASEELRDDEEVVLEAVKNDAFAFSYVSERLKDNKEIVLTTVKKYGRAFSGASERLRDDKELVLVAIEKDAFAFSFASERLKDDKEVVLAAVEKDRYVLRFASERLQKEILENQKQESNPTQQQEPKISLHNEFEKQIPDKMRLKYSDILEDGSLYWITQEIFSAKDVIEFQKALKESPLEKAYITARDFSDHYKFQEDIQKNIFVEITPNHINIDNYLSNIENRNLQSSLGANIREQREIIEKHNEINQNQEKNSMNEKIESLIGIVANNKEDENVGHKVKLFNDLSDTDKVFFKENATNIAIEQIEELQEGISNAEKESITAKFNTFFKQVEEAPKLNNEKEQVLSYLKNQMMYLGFGQDKNLHNQLEKGIEEAKNGEKFQISTPYDKVQEGNTANFTINFHKSSENAVYLNSFKAVLKDGNTGEERTHLFGVNNFTAKEAINLLEGRAVKTQFTNKETQQKNDVFVRLKMNEPKNEFGNYQMQMFSKNYGINTADIVNKSQLVFSGENAEKIKDFVIKSLEKGNIVNVRFKDDNNKEMNGKAIFNPQYKTINLYDEQMNRVNTNKPIKGLEVDLQQDKNNVREQSRVRSHH